MKIFGLYILRQKTFDGLALEASIQIVEARRKAVVMPNKMISRLLWALDGKPTMKLREKMANARRTY